MDSHVFSEHWWFKEAFMSNPFMTDTNRKLVETGPDWYILELTQRRGVFGESEKKRKIFTRELKKWHCRVRFKEAKVAPLVVKTKAYRLMEKGRPAKPKLPLYQAAIFSNFNAARNAALLTFLS